MQLLIRLVDDLDDFCGLLFCAASPACLNLIVSAALTGAAAVVVGTDGVIAAVTGCALYTAIVTVRSLRSRPAPVNRDLETRFELP